MNLEDITRVNSLEEAISKKVSDNLTSFLAAEIAQINVALEQKVDRRINSLDEKYEERFDAVEENQAILEQRFWPKWILKWIIGAPIVMMVFVVVVLLIVIFKTI